MRFKFFALSEVAAVIILSPREGIDFEGAIRRVKDPLTLAVVGSERKSNVQSISFVAEDFGVVEVLFLDCGQDVYVLLGNQHIHLL